METLTDTYTLRVTVIETEDGQATATVSALVQDGRSSGPYFSEDTYTGVDPRRIAAVILDHVQTLARRGQILHADA